MRGSLSVYGTIHLVQVFKELVCQDIHPAFLKHFPRGSSDLTAWSTGSHSVNVFTVSFWVDVLRPLFIPFAEEHPFVL